MAEPIAQELKYLESSEVVCYNGFLNCSVIVFPHVIGVMCDNPQASNVLIMQVQQPTNTAICVW